MYMELVGIIPGNFFSGQLKKKHMSQNSLSQILIELFFPELFNGFIGVQICNGENEVYGKDSILFSNFE